MKIYFVINVKEDDLITITDNYEDAKEYEKQYEKILIKEGEDDDD